MVAPFANHADFQNAVNIYQIVLYLFSNKTCDSESYHRLFFI